MNCQDIFMQLSTLVPIIEKSKLGPDNYVIQGYSGAIIHLLKRFSGLSDVPEEILGLRTPDLDVLVYDDISLQSIKKVVESRFHDTYNVVPRYTNDDGEPAMKGIDLLPVRDDMCGRVEIRNTGHFKFSLDLGDYEENEIVELAPSITGLKDELIVSLRPENLIHQDFVKITKYVNEKVKRYDDIFGLLAA